MIKKRYSDSFKEEAVKLVKGEGRSIAQAAQGLGMSVTGLPQWIKMVEVEHWQRGGLKRGEKAEKRELK